MTLERTTNFLPAYDRRHDNRGIHGADLLMSVKGDRGGVIFVVYTNWYLPHVTDELLSGTLTEMQVRTRFLPYAAELSFHGKKPFYGGQTRTNRECKMTDDDYCYCDGSTLMAEDILTALIQGGSESVWVELENLYHEKLVDVD
jgi:hypothetical protein